MTDDEIEAYYNLFDFNNMSIEEAQRLLNNGVAHYNASRQKSRLLYDWLLRKIAGLPM